MLRLLRFLDVGFWVLCPGERCVLWFLLSALMFMLGFLGQVSCEYVLLSLGI